MPRPATIIKLFVHPQFTVVGNGRIETVIPLLRQAGAHSGSLPTPQEIDHETTQVAFLWAAQIYRVVPSVTKISYDTAAGRVTVLYDAARLGGEAVISALSRLVGVAIDTIDRFLVADKKRLRVLARRFESELEERPVDLSLNGSDETLREVVRRVLGAG